MVKLNSALRGMLGAVALATVLVVSTFTAANAESINVARADNPGGNEPTVEVSHINGGKPEDLNDGKAGQGDGSVQNWNSWPEAENTTITFTWPYFVEVDSATLHLWTDCPTEDSCSGAVKLPRYIEVAAMDSVSETYVPVTLTGETPAMPEGESGVRDYPVSRTFEQVKTSSIQFTFPNQANPVGATEVEIFGQNTDEPTTEPDPIDPGDPGPFLEVEQVELRTTPGEMPSLPESVWAVYEATESRASAGEAPLVNDLDVTWDTAGISTEDYDEAGDSFTVQGAIEAEDTAIEATVSVYDAPLSDEVDDIDHVSSITTPGIAPEFPKTVTATYSDGSRSSGVPVEWSIPAPEDFDEVEDMGFVDAVVASATYDDYGTFFVVEASPADALPVILIDFEQGSLAPSGWHTSTPSVIVKADRGVSSSPIEALEYCVGDCDADDAEWAPYTFPVPISQQGAVEFAARATDSEDRTAQKAIAFKVDTHAPTTTETHEVNGLDAIVELSASDIIEEADGSGVVRTVWSSGPAEDPNSSENVMWGTYDPDERIRLQLSSTRPTFVHFRSEDAAGNVEEVQTIEFDPVEGPDPEPSEDPSPEPSEGPDPEPSQEPTAVPTASPSDDRPSDEPPVRPGLPQTGD